jgi:uncharacterized protein (TIGR02246 family)
MMTDAFRPERVPGAFMEAWNRHDMQALSALFAEDADFVNVVGMWWTSRPEIEAAHIATHETIFKNSRLEGEVASIKELRPGVAAVHMTWELSGQSGANGMPDEPRRGILLFVVTEEQEGWRIKVAQNTDVVSSPLASSGRD